MAELVAGASVRLEGEAPWLEASDLPFDEKGAVALVVSEHATSGGRPAARLSAEDAGHGAGRGARGRSAKAIELAERVLADSGMARESLALVASLDLKADETAVHAVAGHFGVPARFFPAERLEAEADRLANPSEAVFAEVGCHGVAEGAALAAAGAGGRLDRAQAEGSRSDRRACEGAAADRRRRHGPAAGQAFRRRDRARLARMAISGSLAHGRAGERSRRLFALSRSSRAARGRQDAPRLRSRQGGSARAPRDGACRRGANGRARLLGRCRHLRHGDAGLRACSTRPAGRTAYPTRRGASRSPSRPASRRFRRLPRVSARRSGMISARSRCRTC